MVAVRLWMVTKSGDGDDVCLAWKKGRRVVVEGDKLREARVQVITRRGGACIRRVVYKGKMVRFVKINLGQLFRVDYDSSERVGGAVEIQTFLRPASRHIPTEL
jgi:hypothetical protein